MTDNSSGDGKSSGKTPDNGQVIYLMTDADLEAHFYTLLDLEPIQKIVAVSKIKIPGATSAQIKAAWKKFEAKFDLSKSADEQKNIEAIQKQIKDEMIELDVEGTVHICRVTTIPPRPGFRSQPHLSRYTHTTFHNKFADYGEVDEDKPATWWWLRQPDKRRAYGTTMSKAEGGTIVDGLINVWFGFAVEPIGPEHPNWKAHVGAFCQHLGILTEGVNSIDYNYLLRWIAWSAQHPVDQIGTAIMFRSPSGTGKGLMFRVLLGIFGKHGISVVRPDEITGRFNGVMEDKCLVVLEEATWAGNHQAGERLKTLISEATQPVERKGHETRNVQNVRKIIGASNADWVVNVEVDERRWAVIECPEKTMSAAYFAAFAKLTEDPVFLGCVLGFLKGLKLGTWEAMAELPKGTALANQKASSLDRDWLYWRMVADSLQFSGGGLITSDKTQSLSDEPKMGDDGYVKQSVIHGAWYTSWHIRMRQRGNVVPANVFWRNFRKWCSLDEAPQKRNHKGELLIKMPEPARLNKLLYGWLGQK